MNPNNPNEYIPYFDPSLFPNEPQQQTNQTTVFGFAPYTQAGFSNSQPVPEMNLAPQTQERDAVPETQPPKKAKSKNKGKTKARVESSRGPMAAKSWTKDEEVVLGQVFVDLSEDKRKGNSQRREPFWLKVTAKWHELMGFQLGYRTDSQLNSKWKDVNAKVTKWNAIFNNCMEQRRSGMSDADVLSTAYEEYRLKSNGQMFTHKHVWDAIRFSPKWHPSPLEPSQSSSKRSKTSENYSPGASDVRTSLYADLGLDDDDDDVDDIPEPIRPGGRDKAKRAASSSRQPASSVNIGEKIDTFNNIAMERLKIKQDASERKKEEAARKAKMEEENALREDLKLMMMSDDHLPPDDRDIVRKMKDEIAKRYR